MNTDLAKAIELAGGQTAVAKLLNVSQGTVWGWLNRNVGPLDPNFCPALEAATRGAVTCEQLNSTVRWIRNKRGQVTHYQVRVRLAA